MLQKRRNRDSSLNGAPPQPSFMSKEQMGKYLADLRINKVPRPSGSRPQPPPKSLSSTVTIPSGEKPSSLAPAPRKVSPTISIESSDTCNRAECHQRTQSIMGFGSRSSSDDHTTPRRSFESAPLSTQRMTQNDPSVLYNERGQRWMEKQEARSLREALHAMDMKNDADLYLAAQNEASELVWEHQHRESKPNYSAAPHRRLTEHLRRGSHARSQSMGGSSHLQGMSGQMPFEPSVRKISVESVPEQVEDGPCEEKHTIEVSGIPILPNHRPREPLEYVNTRVHTLWDSPHKKAYLNLSLPRSTITEKIAVSSDRRSSGSRTRKASEGRGKGEFPNIDDKIYEEPEETLAGNVGGRPSTSAMPTEIGNRRLRKPLTKVCPSHDGSARANTAPAPPYGILMDNRTKNISAPIRAAHYTSNKYSPKSQRMNEADIPRESVECVSMTDGKERRSDDIREATSMKMRDRSPRLPSPAFITDSKDRPIVSFDNDWKPKDVNDLISTHREHQRSRAGELHQQALRPIPVSCTSAPVMPSSRIERPPPTPIPTMIVPDIPIISVGEYRSADICSQAESSIAKPSARALPTPIPSNMKSRPLPHHFATTPIPTNASRCLPSAGRPTASCTQCQLPIAGRLVSAAGERFHPECFVCFHCGEGLECVAFYPEPEEKRAGRVSRVQRRAKGEHLEESEGQGQAEDGDEALRFYCHLDFHEFFSPRCRSCKTPIEGEVILACGGEWHAGHFFCAQCGDPFDASTPFIEKEGHAWCANCHTNRFSTRCKKCRKPVTDTVVEALGGEWHAECFRCAECHGGFEDGRYFLRGNDEIPVCVRCEEKRLKA